VTSQVIRIQNTYSTDFTTTNR